MPMRKANQLILQAAIMKRQDDGLDWDEVLRAMDCVDVCPLPTTKRLLILYGLKKIRTNGQTVSP